MLVTIEGLDGVGKTTLVKELSKKLDNKIALRLTKEPGSPLIKANQKIRHMVLEDPTLTEFGRELLFAADADFHRERIESDPGRLYVSDRGLWSHMAYSAASSATGILSSAEKNLLVDIFKQVCALPDAVIYLRGTVALYHERRGDDGKDVIEARGDAYRQHVLDFLHNTLRSEKENGIKVLELDAEDTIDSNVTKSKEFVESIYLGRKNKVDNANAGTTG